MVWCCAFNCNNGENSGRSFFQFPKNRKQRAVWVRMVNRADFKAAERTLICSDHFEDDCFNVNPSVVRSVGMKLQLRLKRGAVPTKFTGFDKQEESAQKRKVRRSLAFQKRRNLEALEEYSRNVSEGTSGSDDEDPGSTSVEPQPVEPQPGTSTDPEESHCDAAVQTRVLAKPVASQTERFGKTRGTQWDRAGLTRSIATQTTCKKFVDAATDPHIPHYDYHSDVASMHTESSFQDHESDDPDWDVEGGSDPDETESDESDCEVLEEMQEEAGLQERKYLVFESCLVALLSICTICLGHCRVFMKKTVGSMVVVQQLCSKGCSRTWTSQPSHQSMPLGNLAMAAGVLFSGASPVKGLNLLKHINLPTISTRTFSLLQASYLIPAINKVWEMKQLQFLRGIGSEALKLGGDARCCSPGHTAKYGSYSLMDLTRAKVVEFQLVQSNEVKNSNAMELEGLKRSLETMEHKGINIMSLTTDRHPQVKKWMRVERPLYLHWFDVWHVAKGIYKKLDRLSSRRGCEILADWARSISNHVYWCAATSEGDEELVRQKWQSVLNHVSNIHSGHGNKYPACQHGHLEERVWIPKGSKAHKELEAVVTSRHLCRDIGSLSPAEQTSSLEAFHKVVCYFAPKSVHFFYSAMKARLTLAVLHFNENSDRAQAETKQGEKKYKVSYPKGRQGHGVVKEVKVQMTYDYVRCLMIKLEELREAYPSYSAARCLREQLNLQSPQPVSSKYVKKSKATLVQEHQSRFNKQK